MGSAIPQVSWDSRPAVARLSRVQLYKLLEARSIPFPVGAAKTNMLKLLEASNVDLNQPVPEIDWLVIEGQDENGRLHKEFYPKAELHSSARDAQAGKHVDYSAEIARRAAEVEQQAEVIDDQADLLRALQDQLNELKANQLPLAKMAPYQLKQIAVQRGINTEGLKSKADLLAALGG